MAAAVTTRARQLSATLTLLSKESDQIAAAAELLVDTLSAGRLVLVCGNGGSAAEAQHLAGELVGRFRREREPWPVLALTADTAVLTAVANDYGYETVFARQVAGLGRRGDVLIGFSTSGESPNVVNAARVANERGMRVVVLTGRRPSSLGRLADIEIAVPANETDLVQEVHTVLVHLISDVVETQVMSMYKEMATPR
jgi:D-sedoheptulose 7-phosphate isomerase